MSPPAYAPSVDSALHGSAPVALRRPNRAAGAVLSPRLLALGAVALATGLALALRLFGLGDRPFWVDEMGTWAYAQLAPVDLIGKLGRLELTPPAYYLSARAWIGLAGDEEFWLRLPSALLGAATVPVFAAFLWRAFSPLAAAWGALLLAVAATHLRYAQEARVYPILFLLFVCGLLLALRLVDRQSGELPAGAARRWWPMASLLALTGGMLVHLHFTGVFLLATIFVYALALLVARGRLSPQALLPFVAAGTGAVLLLLPILPMALAIVGNTEGAAYWLPVPGPGELWRDLRLVMFAPQLASLSDPVACLSLLALGAALFLCRRDPDAMALAAALGFAVLSLFLVSQGTPVLMERTALFILALYLALLAAGLAKLRRPGLLLAAFAAAAILPQLAGTARHALRVQNFYGEVWDRAAERLAAQAKPGEAILVVGAFEAIALDHYLRQLDPELRTAVAIGDSEEGVNTMVIRLSTGAEAIPARNLLEPGILCATGLSDAAGVRVVTRDIDGLRLARTHLRQALLQAGAKELDEAWDGNVASEHWSALRCG